MKFVYYFVSSTLLLIIILGVMYPISGFKDLSSSLVAWGTLMLAATTFTLVQHNIKQEGIVERTSYLRKSVTET